MIPLTIFIESIPERYKIIWFYIVKLKYENMPNKINNEIEYKKWFYIQFYIKKLLALILCAYNLNILENIPSYIILDGINFIGSTSFEKELYNILSKEEYIDYPEIYINNTQFLEFSDKLNCIYHALLLSLKKLNILNKISINSIFNGYLEDEILKIFNINIDNL
jgi:hypothetical protein